MAGRGTDILLGGNPEVMALEKCQHDKNHPGLRGDPREASRRNAPRSATRSSRPAVSTSSAPSATRAGGSTTSCAAAPVRQGDPGSSQFFLSLEDDLLRIFEADRVKQWWDRVGVEEGEAIENRMLSRVIENAQKKVEGRNFDIRKHLLDYDNVMNKQRHAFYARRLAAMTADEKAVEEEVQACLEGYVADLLGRTWPARGEPEDDDYAEMRRALEAQFGLTLSIEEPPFRTADGKRHPESDALGHAILSRLNELLEAKKAEGQQLAEVEYAEVPNYPTYTQILRDLHLQILDQQWKQHLHTMDQLRGGISMRAYAQRDPKLEYQREGFALFGEMEQRIDDTLAEYALKFSFPRPDLGPKVTAATRGRRARPRSAAEAAEPGR